MKTKAKTQQSFAFDEEPKQWKEVSQDYFLSWSSSMQFSYCMRRDLDSASLADTPEEKQFFLERAESYRQLMNAA